MLGPAAQKTCKGSEGSIIVKLPPRSKKLRILARTPEYVSAKEVPMAYEHH